jgi:hypothetical protein
VQVFDPHAAETVERSGNLRAAVRRAPFRTEPDTEKTQIPALQQLGVGLGLSALRLLNEPTVA